MFEQLDSLRDRLESFGDALRSERRERVACEIELGAAERRGETLMAWRLKGRKQVSESLVLLR